MRKHDKPEAAGRATLHEVDPVSRRYVTERPFKRLVCRVEIPARIHR